MKNKNLILIGGGGHCKSVIEVVKNCGYDIVGIFDKAENIGKQIGEHKIIGTDERIPEYINDCLFIITVGQIKNPNLRIKLHQLILENGGKLAAIISTNSYFSEHATIGEGSIVMNHALVNSNVEIGKNCIINSKALIEHDSVIGDNTHISTGVIINGSCTIGKNCLIGSGSILSNNITIPDNTIVGLGSIVHKSIDEPGIYFGHPLSKQKL